MNSFVNYIKKFPQQLKWKPQLVDGDNLGQLKEPRRAHKKIYVLGGSGCSLTEMNGLRPFSEKCGRHRAHKSMCSDSRPLPLNKIIVVGMGGSHLAADLLDSVIGNIVIHKNYGLPNLTEEDFKKSLVIISSYSGNTEESINAFELARRKKLNLAVIASGGKLLESAKRNKISYVQLPSGIQPRMALGYSLRAMLKIIGDEKNLRQLEKIKFAEGKCEAEGRKLAKILAGKIPLIYSSAENETLAKFWKIILNENAKVPAFYNIFPELNHNEMEGFQQLDFNKLFHFLILEDSVDNPRIKKRMKVFQQIFRGHGFEMSKLNFDKSWQGIFNNILTAIWASYYLAKSCHVDPESIPLVEEFKKTLSNK